MEVFYAMAIYRRSCVSPQFIGFPVLPFVSKLKASLAIYIFKKIYTTIK
jgi:hypothetical protein